MNDDTSTETVDSGNAQQSGAAHENQTNTLPQEEIDKYVGIGLDKAAKKYESQLAAANERLAELEAKQLEGATAEDLTKKFEEANGRAKELETAYSSSVELIDTMLASRVEALPETIRDLMPQGMTPTAKLEWLDKAEKAAPKKAPTSQGGALPTEGDLSIDVKAISPAHNGGNTALYMKACAEHGKAKVDAAIAAYGK